MNANFSLFPKQMEFFAAKERYVHFCGGIGAGKTRVGAIWAAVQALTTKGMRLLIIARDYGQLKNATLVEFFDVLKLMGQKEGKDYIFNRTDFKFEFTNGNVINCVGVNNPDSAFRGPTYSHCWADEAEFYPSEVWLKLKGRIRKEPGLVRITSSPNGFNYLYEEFEVTPSKDHKIIKATTLDNPTLPDWYIVDLKAAYTPKMFAQECLAQRVALNLQSVYEEFDRTKHLESIDTMPHEQIYAFLDYNINFYPCVYVVKRGPVLYALDEEMLEYKGSRAMAEQIKGRWPGRSVIVVGDSTGNNKRDVAIDEGNYTIFRKAGLPTQHFSNPPVESRIINANNRLFHNQIKVDPRCFHLIKDLEQVSYNEKGQIDKKSNLKLTHMSDAFTYGIWFHMPLVKPSLSNGSFNLI